MAPYYAYDEAGPVVINDGQRAEMRVRKSPNVGGPECPAFEPHEGWGSRFFGDSCWAKAASPHIYRVEPVILGEFRVRVEDPDFDTMFVSRANS